MAITVFPLDLGEIELDRCRDERPLQCEAGHPTGVSRRHWLNHAGSAPTEAGSHARALRA